MIMRILVLALLTLPVAAVSAEATQEDTRPLAERAQEQAKLVSDVDAFLAELDDSLRLARTGGYGRVRRGDINRLEFARNRIVTLLKGHANASELSPENQVALYENREMIARILRSDNKNRIVCKRETKLGTRLPTTECLTLGQREERARAARENTDRAQRNLCYVGEGNSCN